MQVTAKGFVLIQTKEVSMRPEDVNRVFQNNAESLTEWITKGAVMHCVTPKKNIQPVVNQIISYNTLICVPAGPVVALELNGDGVVEACRAIADEMFNGTKVNIRGSCYF